MRNTRVIVRRYGGPEALQVIEEECPEPRDDQVRVRVRVLAAGVSLPDVMMREGVHPETPHRLRAIAIFGVYIAGGWLLPGRKRVVPYSIQTLKRLKPAMFREDLSTLFGLLQQQKIRPLVAERLPLAEAAA